MYLIDSTVDYFNGKNSIPNISESISETKDIVNNLIETKLPELLNEYVLGIDLFKDFESNLNNGQLKPDAVEKWKDFVNGKEYEVDSKKRIWKGLINGIGSRKESFLANYIFHLWLEDNATQVTASGEQAIQVVNSNVVLNNRRLIESWNIFIANYQGIFSDFNCHIGLHKGILFKDYCSGNNEHVSLIKFLNDHKEDYPSALCRLFRTKNTFNL